MATNRQLGLAIKNARIDCDLTQEELAARADISCRYLIGIENQGRIPKYEILSRIIHGMNVSADRFFYLEALYQGSDKEQLIHLIDSLSAHDIHVLLCAAKAMLEDT